MFINHSEILDNRVAVVEIDGPLDSSTSPDFEDYINRLLGRNILFILFDSGKLKYVSSEGIGLLLFLQRKISEANGFFVIFNLPHEILALYALLGFDKVFRIAQDRAEALQIIDRQMELRERGYSARDEAAASVTAAGSAGAGMEPFTEIAAPRSAQASQEQVPSSAVAEATSGGNQPLSRIVECTNCRSLMRVSRDGDYLCPHCNTEFTVSGQDNRRLGPESIHAASGFGALIVECRQCKSLIRVKKPGTYSCPDCRTTFAVAEDQTVRF